MIKIQLGDYSGPSYRANKTGKTFHLYATRAFEVQLDATVVGGI